MKTKISKVRTGGEIVGEVEIPVYETMDELIANEEEKNILASFNHGNAIRIQGNERAKHQEKAMNKKQQLEIAFNYVLAEVLSEEELDECKSDYTKLLATVYENEEVVAATKAKFKELLEAGELDA